MWPSILIRVVHGYLHEIRASFAADRGRLFTTSGATSGAGLGTATASASSRPSDVTTVNCGSYVERAAGEQDFQGWSRLVEDFLALGSGNLHGVPLARDADGTVRTFALLSAKSDFGSAHSAARDEVSSECLAFTDMRETATWRLGELHGEGRLLNGVVVALDELCNLLHAAFLLPEPSDVARVRDLCPDFGQAYQRMRELSRRSGVYVLN